MGIRLEAHFIPNRSCATTTILLPISAGAVKMVCLEQRNLLGPFLLLEYLILLVSVAHCHQLLVSLLPPVLCHYGERWLLEIMYNVTFLSTQLFTCACISSFVPYIKPQFEFLHFLFSRKSMPIHKWWFLYDINMLLITFCSLHICF